MIFSETRLEGVFVIEPEKWQDERGFFARVWCQEEFVARGLKADFVQCNISFNRYRGTLRGMHYQAMPYGEVKLVRCTAGAVYDVVIDLRPDSATFTQWVAVKLTAENRCMLYIPEMCAHGFLSLLDQTEVFYQMGSHYAPNYGRGVRWNDPAFGVQWPDAVRIISERDQTYPDFACQGRRRHEPC